MISFLPQKQALCEIGRRVYEQRFVAANEGNLSTRVEEDRVLITPTLHSKGLLTPDDICEINMDGEVVGGTGRPSSEYRLHLTIYRNRDDVRHVVHCHPPHVTAFAVTRTPIPNRVLPEPDIFLGQVPMADYETPGNQGFANTVIPHLNSSNAVVLANHGMVSFDGDLERALWSAEILDSYCRVLILARQLGELHVLSDEQGRQLQELRKQWGFEVSGDAIQARRASV